MDSFNKEKIRWLKDFYGNPSAYYPLKIPGVTAILDLIPDPDLEKFIKDVGEEKAKQIMEDAANRGKSMHLFIENFIIEFAKSKDPSSALQHTLTISPKTLATDKIPMDKIDKGREMFLNFYYSEYANSYYNLIGTELALYSPLLFYRGKADVFYNENGIGRVVTDFKTSSKLIKKGSIKELKYKRQLGAYALGLEHMLSKQDVKINKASLLVIQTKSTIIQEIVCCREELEQQKNEFEKLVKEWHYKNNQGFLFDC